MRQAIRVISIINSTLKEIPVDLGDIVVGFYLARYVMAIYSEGVNMLAHLLYWLQRLQHLCAPVQHVLPHRHRFSWRDRLISTEDKW